MKLAQFDLARFPNLRRSGGEKGRCVRLTGKQTEYTSGRLFQDSQSKHPKLAELTAVPQEGSPLKSDLFIRCLTGRY